MSTDSPIDAQTSALLVMDYQRGIIARLENPDDLLARAAYAVEIARKRGMLVAYVRVAFTHSDLAAIPVRNKMRDRIAASGNAMYADSPETQIDPRVAPRNGDVVVRKTRVGPFSSTDLAQQLKHKGVTTLVLAGISTSGVVLSTVREGADRDYRLIVLSDACADPDEDVHHFLIERILTRQADVMTVEEFAS